MSVCAAVTSCSKPKADVSPPAPTVVASTPPTAVASAAATTPQAVAATSGNMAHCPSSVAGSSTVISDAPGGIALTVTAPDATAAQEIRARVAFLVSAARNSAAPITHNGTGEGGGTFGRCPIVMRNTRIESSDLANGASLTVTPADPREQDWLRRESRSRLAELTAAPGSGHGKMAHCPNAVSGASTAVSDGSDAVAITVTAKSDDAVKEIRDRARQIVAAAAKVESAGSASITHDGTGDGGGGFGRCPVVLKDTAVSEKDAPGGAVITVKPKNAKDLPALDHQVRDRSARFN